MKTPDEIKKGLLCCSHSNMPCSECPYDGICNTDSGETPEADAVGLIDQLLSSYSQVSKALCGKENATLEELLQTVDQLKNDLQYTTDAANIMKDEALKLESRLVQAERERDAAVGLIREAQYRVNRLCEARYHLDMLDKCRRDVKRLGICEKHEGGKAQRC